MIRFPPLLTALLLTGACTVANGQTKPTPMFSRDVEACIIPAAQYHKVNFNILWAILKVESNFKPKTVTTNENGTNDYGMGGMNSIHMPGLARHGVTPENIKDPCISTYVTAWHLSKEILKHGNTWYGVAAYHSATPYFNNRYQILLKNALVDAGVLPGPKEAVPPLRQGGKTATGASKQGKPNSDTQSRESSMSVVEG